MAPKSFVKHCSLVKVDKSQSGFGPTKKRYLFNSYLEAEQEGTSTVALVVKNIWQLQTAMNEESFH